jgi:hypothetical protein
MALYEKIANYYWDRYGHEEELYGTLNDIVRVWSGFVEYTEGVPSPIAAEYALESGKSRVVAAWEKRLEEIRETLIKESRWRPAYFTIVYKILDHDPSLLQRWLKGEASHREVAEVAGYSWRTVRDAAWAFRRAGLIE